MTDPLDYARSPNAEYGNVYRRGYQLVVRKGAHLPARCAKCNKPMEGTTRRLFAWHDPQLSVLWAIPVIYVIVAAIVTKWGTANIAYCPEHVVLRRVLLAISWILLAVAFLLCVLSGVLSSMILFIVGMGVMYGGLGLLLFGGKLLTAEKIDKEWMYLRGAHPEFLKQFEDTRKVTPPAGTHS